MYYTGHLCKTTIPDGIETVTGSIFPDNHFEIDSFYIPKSIKNISKDFFEKITIKNIEIAEDNENYKSIKGNIFTKDGTKLIYCYNKESLPPMKDIYYQNIYEYDDYGDSDCISHLGFIYIPKHIVNLDEVLDSLKKNVPTVDVYIDKDNPYFKIEDRKIVSQKDGKIIYNLDLFSTYNEN